MLGIGGLFLSPGGPGQSTRVTPAALDFQGLGETSTMGPAVVSNATSVGMATSRAPALMMTASSNHAVPGSTSVWSYRGGGWPGERYRRRD